MKFSSANYAQARTPILSITRLSAACRIRPDIKTEMRTISGDRHITSVQRTAPVRSYVENKLRPRSAKAKQVLTHGTYVPL